MMVQKLLEERKGTLSKKDTLYNQKQKTYTVGLREGMLTSKASSNGIAILYVTFTGQHRLALMQTRKEHSRLEKTLLQQQRDLRKLEQAYRTTKAGKL